MQSMMLMVIKFVLSLVHREVLENGMLCAYFLVNRLLQLYAAYKICVCKKYHTYAKTYSYIYIHLNSIAKELARTGNVKIIVNDIEPMKEEAEKLCKEIRDAGVEAIALTADCKSLHIYVMLSFSSLLQFTLCTMLFHTRELIRSYSWNSNHRRLQKR